MDDFETPFDDFPFLQKLDELKGRLVDNAGFVAISAKELGTIEEPGTMDDAIPLSLDPEGDHPDELPLGELVEATGVFDHPAASSCTISVDDGQSVPTSDCRFWFAVTRLALAD